jgi:hypothetical protein
MNSAKHIFHNILLSSRLHLSRHFQQNYERKIQRIQGTQLTANRR